MYVRFGGPETLSLGGNRLVKSKEDYMAWLDRQLASKGRVAELSADHGAIAARVMHGLWVVDCRCGGACLTRPDWKLACCCECGTVYDNVAFPRDVVAITAVLLSRPERCTQNWKAPETVAFLLAENQQHGLAVQT